MIVYGGGEGGAGRGKGEGERNEGRASSVFYLRPGRTTRVTKMSGVKTSRTLQKGLRSFCFAIFLSITRVCFASAHRVPAVGNSRAFDERRSRESMSLMMECET